MRSTTCLWAMLSVAIPAVAGPMTNGERERALSELHASRKQFLDSIEGLSAQQWNYKPDDKTWSVAEVSEHIAISEDTLMGLVRKQMLNQAAEPGQKSENTDEKILKGVADRSHKAQAPEMLQPKHQWASRDELTAHFRQSREKTLDYVRSSQDNLRDHLFKHPALGMMDAYQWILLISAHTQRHTAQIEEVKAGAQFPKR